MSTVNALLNERLKKKQQKTPKAAALAKQSARGNLSGFSGIFGTAELSPQEKDMLQEILLEYSDGKANIKKDLTSLIGITSEVKAINNQAALLHGERIKKAQTVLKNYQDGAFTAWLIATYGNRQTPYNFLQYYEFYTLIPMQLRPQIELMPRQAIYTLASREGTLEKKVEIVEEYQGETKDELLRIIRDSFPLSGKDRRRRDPTNAIINHLTRVRSLLAQKHVKIKKSGKKEIEELIQSIKKLLC